MSWVLNPLTGRVQQSDGGQLGPPSPYGKTPTGSAQLGPKAPYTPNANANYVFDEYFKAASSWNTAKNSAGGLLNEGQPFPDEAIWNTKIEMAKSRDDSAKYERDRQDGLDADALRRSDALAKSSGSGSSAAQKKADKLEADRKGRAGAKAGADFQEGAARSGAATAQTKIDELFATLKGTANELNATEETRIKGLYDGLDESAKTRFDEQIGQLGLDTAASEKTIATANKSFADNFQGSSSFQGVPVQQFETGANPLIGALQAQGAGTSEVNAAIASENQGMKGTADLQKWMISQLNTGSQNFDKSVKNAASQAGAASLAELLQRSTSIKGGMTRDASLATDERNLARGGEQSAAASAFAAALSRIASGKTDATAGVTTTLQTGLAAADSTRADSLTAYGPAPKAKLNFAQQVAAKHPNFKGTTAQAKKKFPKLFAGK